MKRNNILIIDNSRATTGAFTSILLLLPYLTDYRFHIALPKGSTLKEDLICRNIPVIEIPFLELKKSFRSVFYLPVLVINSVRLLRVIRQRNIHLVHVNDLYNLCGVVLKLINPKLRVAYHIRLLPTSYLKPVYPILARIVLRYADAVICNSTAVKNSLPHTAKNMLIIGNPVNPVERYPTKICGRVNNLLVLANYVPGKGHDYALQAFAKVHQVLPQLRLILAGGTFGERANERYKNKLKVMALKWGVEHHVEFRDFQEDVEKLIKEADIVLQFSESESFSRVTAESMQYGVPVIAVNSGGPSGLIQHKVTGILVKNGDIPGMVEALIKLAENPTLCNTMAAAARTFIIDNFKADFIASQVESLYRELLA